MDIFKKDKGDWIDKHFKQVEADKMKACKHERRKDLTNGLGVERNFYCPDCKTHWYKGKIWPEKEWNAYVNDFSDTDIDSK
jgi:hypothetical protein